MSSAIFEFMVVEAAVTEVKRRKDCAFLRFKDLGGVHYKDWQHIFPTVRLDRRQLDDLEARVTADVILGEFQFIRKEHAPYFNFGQLMAPFGVSEHLPDEFVTGNYKWQLWRRWAWPGSLVAVAPEIKGALQKRNELQEKFIFFKEGFPERIGKSPSYCSQVFNKLNEVFGFYDGDIRDMRERINQTRVKKSVSDGLLDERAVFAEAVGLINEGLKKYNGSVEWDNERNLFDVFYSGGDAIRVLRALNFEEREKQVVDTLDIEIPLWDTDNPVISWLGSSAFCGDKVLSRDIYTIHDLKKKKVEGYKITSGLGSEGELVKRVREEIARIKPDRVAAFHNNFDLMKLRETGEFDIGEDDSRPVYEVHLNFFERIGLTGKEIEDILRAVQTMYNYLPNNKLKTVLPHATRHLPEIKHKVDLSYKEMEAAELAGEFDKIVGYLPTDVEANRLIMRSPDYLKFSEDCCFLSRFRMPYTWLIYSTRTIKNIFKMFYFERVGSYWETVRYGHKDRKKAMEQESQLKENFKDWFGGMFGKEKPGFYKDVQQVYLPIGEFLRKELCADRRRYDFGSKKRVCLSDVVQQIFAYSDDIDANDFQRKFQFSMFTSSMADFIVVDFMEWFKERRGLVEEIEKNEIDYNKFCDKFDYFKAILESGSKWGIHHLKNGTLTVEGMSNHLDDLILNFLSDNNLDEEDFHKYALKQVNLDRLAGRFRANFNVHPGVVLRTLEEKAKKIKDYLAGHGLEVVGRGGLYLYITGESDFSGPPIIPVDTIDNVFVSDKVYYERYGALNGFKLDDESKHTWNIWQMNVFGSFIDAVLQGDPVGAMCDLYNDLDCYQMRKGVGGEDLLWHSKSSGRYRGFENGERVYFYAEEEKFAEAKVRVAKKILKLPFLRKSLTGDLGDKKKISKYLKRFAENPSVSKLEEDLLSELDEEKFEKKLKYIYDKRRDLSDDEKFIQENNIHDFATFFDLAVGDDENLIEKLYRRYRPICLRRVTSFQPDYEMYMERYVRFNTEGFKHDAAELSKPLVGLDNAYYIINHALKDGYKCLEASDFEEMMKVKQ